MRKSGSVSLSEFARTLEAEPANGCPLPRGPGDAGNGVPEARTRKWVGRLFRDSRTRARAHLNADGGVYAIGEPGVEHPSDPNERHSIT